MLFTSSATNTLPATFTAIYSTFPFDNVVGPGIGRGEVRRLPDELAGASHVRCVAGPGYDFAESKAERLLLAGLDYSLDRLVVYVAAKPPWSVFRSIAACFGRTIIFICRSASFHRSR
jgi:hypothetical protein